MFRHRFHNASSIRTCFDWFLLSFLAGCINTGGFLAAHRFVSHITGFGTLFGVGASEGKWDQAIGLLSIPAYFLLGVMTSAYLTDRQIAQNKRPHYALVMTLVFVCLSIVAIGGMYGWFGTFGSEPRLTEHYLVLALLCAASGLQNAAITTSSRGTIRATHLTGPTTDLGIGIVRALSHPQHRRHEMRLVRLRLGMITSFVLGSTGSAYLYMHYGYGAFLFPAGISSYAIFEALTPLRRLRRIKRRSTALKIM